MIDTKEKVALLHFLTKKRVQIVDIKTEFKDGQKIFCIKTFKEPKKSKKHAK